MKLLKIIRGYLCQFLSENEKDIYLNIETKMLETENQGFLSNDEDNRDINMPYDNNLINDIISTKKTQMLTFKSERLFSVEKLFYKMQKSSDNVNKISKIRILDLPSFKFNNYVDIENLIYTALEDSSSEQNSVLYISINGIIDKRIKNIVQDYYRNFSIASQENVKIFFHNLESLFMETSLEIYNREDIEADYISIENLTIPKKYSKNFHSLFEKYIQPAFGLVSDTVTRNRLELKKKMFKTLILILLNRVFQNVLFNEAKYQYDDQSLNNLLYNCIVYSLYWSFFASDTDGSAQQLVKILNTDRDHKLPIDIKNFVVDKENFSLVKIQPDSFRKHSLNAKDNFGHIDKIIAQIPSVLRVVNLLNIILESNLNIVLNGPDMSFKTTILREIINCIEKDDQKNLIKISAINKVLYC